MSKCPHPSQKRASITQRPRRNRRTDAIRSLVRETDLRARNLVQPLFIQEGVGKRDPIRAMPGTFRLSIDKALEAAAEAYAVGVRAIAIFPFVAPDKRDPRATESINPKGLLQRSIAALKDHCPDLCVISDVAMDPYSTDGHDGLVEDGVIVNDPTLDILSKMACAQAKAGADIVAPSDMMDGRVAAIRRALDAEGQSNTGILAYTAKYASALYGPFRSALQSAPGVGDKRSYQMDPANAREALRELRLDEAEGADIVMVKPALPYLDILYRLRQKTSLPLAAYQVSGEVAMIHAAAKTQALDADDVMMECLMSIKRAGADIIFTYAATQVAGRISLRS